MDLSLVYETKRESSILSGGTKKVIMYNTGFTCGSFDLLHYGHIIMFKECRDKCNKLIVGVQTDPTIDREHKNKPIQSVDERVGQVWALKFVDKVIIYQTEEDLLTLLRQIKPDVRFVGQDHRGTEFTGHEADNIVFNSRKHKYSTSELRRRIVAAEKNK